MIRARSGLLAAAVAVTFLCGGCRKAARPPSSAGGPEGLPKGDAVWFTDPAAVGDPGIEDRLARLSVVAVFLPAGELGSADGRWVLRADAPPPHPLGRASAVLVARAGPELAAAIASETGPSLEAVAQPLIAGLEPAFRSGGAYGRVIGVHLDFPFTAASAKKAGELVASVRERLPAGAFVSIAADFPAPQTNESRKSLAPLVDRADALVAPIFGLDHRSDATAIDALHRPWWAAFGAAVRGQLVRAGGGAPEEVAEQSLDALSGDPRMDFENDLSVPDASFAAFHLTARSPLRSSGLELGARDRITYRVPALAEMLFQLGSTMAGKRFALGRLLVFGGASESARVFSMAALEDVILGRSLAPMLSVSVQPAGRNAIAVEAVNPSVHASLASRTANWVEVDVAPAHPADVSPGGFDRYATYDASGQPVTPGRATRVRLFETLVRPAESISPARIVLRGAVPTRCCRSRTHLIAAAGPEEETSWTEPPMLPTPTGTPNRKKR